jgi:hypothetical protein
VEKGKLTADDESDVFHVGVHEPSVPIDLKKKGKNGKYKCNVQIEESPSCRCGGHVVEAISSFGLPTQSVCMAPSVCEKKSNMNTHISI